MFPFLRITIKNKKSILFGILISIIVILFIAEFFQYLLGKLIVPEDTSIKFLFIVPLTSIIPDPSRGYLVSIILYLANYFFFIFSIELFLQLLKATALGLWRFTITTAVIIIFGFTIVSIFYKGILSVLDSSPSNDISSLAFVLGISGEGIIAFIFFLIIIFIAYVNLFAKRILQYVNIN